MFQRSLSAFASPNVRARSCIPATHLTQPHAPSPAASTHLVRADLPPGELLDEPWLGLADCWARGMVHVEDELWNGQIIWDVRDGTAVCVDLRHRLDVFELG